MKKKKQTKKDKNKLGLEQNVDTIVDILKGGSGVGFSVSA